MRPFLLVVTLALATAGPASAHAIPLETQPASGTILATAPSTVAVNFDSPVQVGPRNAAIRDDGANVLGGAPHVALSTTLVIPLKPGLTNGDYSVRWSIISDDGHEEEGVVAFGVGTATAPTAALSTEGFVTWQRVAMRTLFLLGVLGAAGAAFFSVFVLGGALPQRQAQLSFAFFLSAFAGAGLLLHATAASGTRFERFAIIALAASIAGAVASALAPLVPQLRYAVWVAAAALFPCPTLGGHAFDANQPSVIAPAADLLHLGGAAVWFGGVASLALARTGTVKRFARFALPAVVLVAIGGGARAFTELSSFSQIWTTSYGRTLIVKAAIFATVLAIAWLARRRLLLVQLMLLVALVTAVGALTDLPPARDQTSRAALALPPPPPPAGAFVNAAQAGDLAVGFAWLDGKATVTLVGPEGGAVKNEHAAIAHSGRSYRVTVAGTTLRFTVPAKRRSAAAVLARATRDFDSAPALGFVEHLSSGPGNLVVTDFREGAPNRLAYRIISSTQPDVAGDEAIVIGSRRWDRKPGGPWVEQVQPPLEMPRTYWGAQTEDAFFTGSNEITFYDSQLHAWYRLKLDTKGRPAELTMTAASHFMHHVYRYDSPPISPPAR